MPPFDDPALAARALAEERLLPDAAAVDRADRVPGDHLRALDSAGLTSLAASGAPLATRFRVAEALAGGCLATAFVWLQHQGALGAVAAAGEPVASWAPRLASGGVRAGVAITALRGPEPLTVRSTDGGRFLSGRVPWVTGWGIVEVLRVAALDEEGDVVSALVDVGGATGEPLDLIAARASRTHAVTFRDHPVPADRLISTVPQDAWWAGDAAGLAMNGALALGVAGRAAALAGSDLLTRAVDETRSVLLAARPERLPAARAAASALAVRAAAALAVTDGARSVVRGGHAERLMREAQFLTVFGSRPAIRAALVEALGG